MNKQTTLLLVLSLLLTIFVGCKEETKQGPVETPETHDNAGGKGDMENKTVHLSQLKFNSLGIQIGTLPITPLSEAVKANGKLEVPPQYEATVTAILGGNVSGIKIIEGDKVSKGQTLGYLSHPDLTKIQTDYSSAYARMQFLEREYGRQQRLYEEKVASGKAFQQIEAEYRSKKAEVNGYESQLKQLNISPSEVRNGKIMEYVPITSPISGYIEKVLVRIGQYMEPSTSMFMIVDNEHIHADLMVFEKDVHRVKKGQKVSFTLESAPEIVLSGKIYSVGKQFEQNPKAVHVHAEIDQKEEFLIPGMYINGRISTGAEPLTALPEDAIVEEGGKSFIFTARTQMENGNTAWELKPLEVRTGLVEDGWTEIKLLEPLPKNTQVLLNDAYYMISEMQKSETSHEH